MILSVLRLALTLVSVQEEPLKLTLDGVLSNDNGRTIYLDANGKPQDEVPVFLANQSVWTALLNSGRVIVLRRSIPRRASWAHFLLTKVDSQAVQSVQLIGGTPMSVDYEVVAIKLPANTGKEASLQLSLAEGNDRVFVYDPSKPDARLPNGWNVSILKTVRLGDSSRCLQKNGLLAVEVTGPAGDASEIAGPLAAPTITVVKRDGLRVGGGRLNASNRAGNYVIRYESAVLAKDVATFELNLPKVFHFNVNNIPLQATEQRPVSRPIGEEKLKVSVAGIIRYQRSRSEFFSPDGTPQEKIPVELFESAARWGPLGEEFSVVLHRNRPLGYNIANGELPLLLSGTASGTGYSTKFLARTATGIPQGRSPHYLIAQLGPVSSQEITLKVSVQGTGHKTLLAYDLEKGANSMPEGWDVQVLGDLNEPSAVSSARPDMFTSLGIVMPKSIGEVMDAAFRSRLLAVCIKEDGSVVRSAIGNGARGDVIRCQFRIRPAEIKRVELRLIEVEELEFNVRLPKMPK